MKPQRRGSTVFKLSFFPFPVRSLHQAESGYTISFLVQHALQALIYFARACNGVQASKQSRPRGQVIWHSCQRLDISLLADALTLPIFAVDSASTEPTLRMIPIKRQASFKEDDLAGQIVLLPVLRLIICASRPISVTSNYACAP